MNTPLLASVLLAASFVLLPAVSHAETAQQQRMADCAHQNKGKKGDEYKAAQKACLSGTSTPAPATATTPQERMKSCNADAKTKNLTGADRKTFMSTCLKKS